ncbi:unnamed protein product [Cladocopium goreaui]|uniref:Calmodulin n=1 Tax=Cladocopium goreaui TaxID=2562237 RepID=A0A9P1FI75_9DINO|nr:unnamed protein product [Cladocopium goreaui]
MTDHAESLPHAKSLEAAVANFLAAFSCGHHQMTVAEAETCVRTSLHPEGIPEMNEKMKVKVLEGNSSVAWLVALLCVFGTAWRKRTKIGEALNPGPKQNRDFLLENVSLISARTQENGALERFEVREGEAEGGAEMASLSEEMVGEIKEAFELFARFGGTDTVEAKKLGTLLASLGMNMPDEDGMPRSLLQHEGRRDNVIHLDDFLVFMEKRVKEDHARQEEELREVFQMLDKDGTGWVNMSEVHDIMAKLGSGLESKFPDDWTPRSEPPQKENWVDWEKFKEMLGS